MPWPIKEAAEKAKKMVNGKLLQVLLETMESVCEETKKAGKNWKVKNLIKMQVEAVEGMILA